jgi:hypothetical protein
MADDSILRGNGVKSMSHKPVNGGNASKSSYYIWDRKKERKKERKKGC